MKSVAMYQKVGQTIIGTPVITFSKPNIIHMKERFLVNFFYDVHISYYSPILISREQRFYEMRS